MRGTCLNAVIWGIIAIASVNARAQDHGGYDMGGGGYGGGDVAPGTNANDIANQVDRQYMDALTQKKSELAQAQAQLAQCAVDEARENGNTDAQLAQSMAQRAGQQAQNDGQNVLGQVIPSLTNAIGSALGSAGQQAKMGKETMALIERKVQDLNADMMSIQSADNRPNYGVQLTKSFVDYTSSDVRRACQDSSFAKKHKIGMGSYASYPSSSTGSTGNNNSNFGYGMGMYPGYGATSMSDYDSCVMGLTQELQALDSRYVQARQDYLAGSGMTSKGAMDAVGAVIGSIGSHALQKGANNLADGAEQAAANNQKQNAAYGRQACETQAKQAIDNLGKAIQQLDNGRGRALMDAALRSQMDAQQNKNAFNVAPNAGAGGTVNVGGPDSLKGAGPMLAGADKKGDGGGGSPAGMAGGGGGGGGGGGEWTFPPGGAPSSGGPSAPIENAQYESLGGGGGGGGFGGDFGFGGDPTNFAMNKNGLGEGDGAPFGDGGINVLLNKMRLIMANHVGGENGLGVMARSLASAKDPTPAPKKKPPEVTIQ